MPIRDIGEYHAWISREAPSIPAQSAARTFIAELGDVPWRADLACLDRLVDAVVGDERVLAALAGDVPEPAWQTIARAVWPVFDKALTPAADARRAAEGWARDLVLVITTQNSGRRGLAPQLGASRAPGPR